MTTPNPLPPNARHLGRPEPARVAGFTADPFPKHGGGPGAVLTLLGESIPADGPPLLVAGLHAAALETLGHRGARGVFRRLVRMLANRPPRALLAARTWSAIRDVRRLINQLRPHMSGVQAVHAHDIYAYHAATSVLPRQSDRRLIVSIHSPGTAVRDLAMKLDAPWSPRLSRWFAARYEVPVLRQADVIVLPSRGAFDVLRDDLAALDLQIDDCADRVRVLYNGIPDAPRPPSGLRHREGLEADTLLVFTAGRLIPDKGMDILLRAVARLRTMAPPVYDRLQVAIAGTGPEEPRLRAGAVDAGITGRVRWLGHRRDVDEWLAAADVIVSLGHRSAFDLFILEAMRAARVVIATDVGGNREAVGDAGWIVPAGSPDAVANAIAELARDDARRLALGAEARARFLDRFTVAKMATAYTDFYEELLTSLGPGSAGQ